MPRRSPFLLFALVAVATAALPASAQIGVPLLGQPSADSLIYRLTAREGFSLGTGLGLIRGGTSDGEFLVLRPRGDFSLGAAGLSQLAIGLDAPVRLRVAGGDSTARSFELRREDYDTTEEVLGILQYVRYGTKNGAGPLHAQFGSLDFARVGYGTLVESYRNEIGEDARRRGLVLDVAAGPVGLETLVGSIGQAGIVAGRGFVRPLQLLTGGHGGLNTLTLGVTFATDRARAGGYVNADTLGRPFRLALAPDGTPTADGIAGTADRGRLRAVGVDLGLPLATARMANASLYGSVNRLSDDASSATGGTGGLLFSLTPPAAWASRLDVRFEAIYAQAGYQPSPFNAFYEVERLIAVDSVAVRDPVTNAVTGFETRYQSRRNTLAASPAQGGLVGQMAAVLGGVMLVNGRYQQALGSGETGWLNLAANLVLPGELLYVRAGLDRWNIGGTAATNTDREGRNFLLKAEGGIRLQRMLSLGMLYQVAFSPVYEAGRVVDNLRQSRIEPVVQFVLPF